MNPRLGIILFFVLVAVAARGAGEDPFENPLTLFADALIPALTKNERGKVQTTWRGFYVRADRQAAFNNEHEPSVNGIYLDVSVRDSVEVPKFSDSTKSEKGITTRTVTFRALGENQEQGLVVKLMYGKSANSETLKAINRCIAQIIRKAAE